MRIRLWLAETQNLIRCFKAVILVRQAPRSVKVGIFASLRNPRSPLLANHNELSGLQGLYHTALDVYFMIVLGFVGIGNDLRELGQC